jgi:hypothetical protein
MDKQHVAIIFLLVLIPYLAYFVRPDLIGTDGYLYLLHVCHRDGFVLNNPANSLVVSFLYSFIPCNVFVVKLLLFVVSFVSSLLLYKIAELYVGKDAVWSVFFCFGFSQLFFFSTVYFEPQQFALPFLFASLYFYLKGKQQDSLLFKFVSLGWLLLAGLIWKGSIVLLFAYGIAFLPALAISFAVLAWQGAASLVVLLPNLVVLENFPLIGVCSLFLLLPGFKYCNNYKKELALLTIIALLDSKFAYLLVPFLCIGATQFFQTLNNKQKTFLFSFAIILFLLTIPKVFLAQPTEDDWKAIDCAVANSKAYSTSLQNDWDYGYWIAWAWVNTIPSSYAGGEYDNLEHKGILITQFYKFLSKDCNVLRTFATKSVWKC